MEPEDTSLERTGGIEPGAAFQHVARHTQDVGALQALQRHVALSQDRLRQE
jgi:hypothetical protein